MKEAVTFSLEMVSVRVSYASLTFDADFGFWNVREEFVELLVSLHVDVRHDCLKINKNQ